MGHEGGEAAGGAGLSGGGGLGAEGEPEVEVLLAAYNGERFLEEQVGSILAQSYGRVRVLARDDGSSDGTPELLRKFAGRWPGRFTVMRTGEATGSAKGNFAKLMGEATGAYVCFADQDDVWLPDKVRVSMEAMCRLEGRWGRERPLLVFTDLRVVDEALGKMAESMWVRSGVNPGNVHRLERLVGQNVVTGCTMLINRRMLELARRMPGGATMHDRWIGLLAATMGAAEAVRERTVLYRQHGANVIGAAEEDWTLRGTVTRVRSGAGRRRERRLSEVQAEALLELHGREMSARSREVLEAYLRSGQSGSAWVRVGTTLRWGFFRSGLGRNLVMLFDLARAKSGVPES